MRLALPADRRPFVLAVLVASLMVPGLPRSSCAQVRTSFGFHGWGPRLGLTVTPDQVHLGLHADFGDFAPRVRFQPNVELGFGDHERVGAINAEAFYRFLPDGDLWNPYLGGGLGLNLVSFSGEGFHHDSETDLGLNLLGGVEKEIMPGNRVFAEMKVGLVDSPDLKITAGWTFLNARR